MREFDPFYSSQAVTQPERVDLYWLKVPHFIRFSCGCLKSLVSRKLQLWREFTESLQPKPEIPVFEETIAGDRFAHQLAARSNGRFQMQTDASLVSRLSLLMPQSGVSNFVLAYAAEQRDGPRST